MSCSISVFEQKASIVSGQGEALTGGASRSFEYEASVPKSKFTNVKTRT